MVQEHQGEHSSRHAAIRLIASKFGCSGDILCNGIEATENIEGASLGAAADERERIKAPEGEVHQLRQANGILWKASAYLTIAEIDRRSRSGMLSPLLWALRHMLARAHIRRHEDNEAGMAHLVAVTRDIAWIVHRAGIGSDGPSKGMLQRSDAEFQRRDVPGLRDLQSCRAGGRHRCSDVRLQPLRRQVNGAALVGAGNATASGMAGPPSDARSGRLRRPSAPPHSWRAERRGSVSSYLRSCNMARKPLTGPRKQASQARSRSTVDALVEATARILVCDGYDKASTNRIADVAGVSVGSLYQYYPSKDALVAAVIDRRHRQIMRRVETVLTEAASQPIDTAVRRMVAAAIDAHRTDFALHRAIAEHIPRTGRLKAVEALDRDGRALFRRYLESRRDELRVCDLDLAALVSGTSLETLTHAAVLRQPEASGDGPLIEEVARLISGYLRPAAG